MYSDGVIPRGRQQPEGRRAMSTVWVDLMDSEVRYRGNAYRTRTIEAGSGDALILIHGVGGHAEAYSRNVTRLGQRFHVAAMDLLWHGYSDKRNYTPSMVPEYAKQVVDLIDALGVQRAHIEGESLGGWVPCGPRCTTPTASISWC